MARVASSVRTVEVVAPKQSMSLAKNMTKLTMSSILHARRILSDKCFMTKPFVDGMSMKQLSCIERPKQSGLAPQAKRGDTTAETDVFQEGALIQQWLELGVFDAIEKQYLKSVSLIVAKASIAGAEGNNSEAEVLESYTLKYEYGANGTCYMSTGAEDGPMLPCSKASTLAQAKMMIRNLNEIQDSLPCLPEGRTVVVKLRYYDHTPDEYEPKYFRSTTAETFSTYQGVPKRVHLGDIKTSHHALSLTFSGGSWLFEDDCEEANISCDKSYTNAVDDQSDQHGMLEGSQTKKKEELRHYQIIANGMKSSVDVLGNQFQRLNTTSSPHHECMNSDAISLHNECLESKTTEDDDETRLDESEDIDVGSLTCFSETHHNQRILSYLKNRPSSSLGM